MLHIWYFFYLHLILGCIYTDLHDYIRISLYDCNAYLLPCSSTCIPLSMDSSSKNESDKIIIDISPVIRLYKSGRVEWHPQLNTPAIPPSLDPKIGVESKDLNISIQTNVFVKTFQTKQPKKITTFVILPWRWLLPWKHLFFKVSQLPQ